MAGIPSVATRTPRTRATRLEIARPAVAAGKQYLSGVGHLAGRVLHVRPQDPNVRVSQLIWGADYGHVPQYIVATRGRPVQLHDRHARWPRVPKIQTDWWGWVLHQIDKLRDYVSQDEINLILGGNAARSGTCRAARPHVHERAPGRLGRSLRIGRSRRRSERRPMHGAKAQ